MFAEIAATAAPYGAMISSAIDAELGGPSAGVKAVREQIKH
jgi:hypothetical protein